MKHSIKTAFQGIFVKFTLMFILVGLIPTMGMAYLIFDKVPEEIESYLVSSYEDVLLYASKNIAQKIVTYDLLSKNIYQYRLGDGRTLAELLKNEDYDALSPEFNKIKEDYLRTILNSDTHIVNAFLLGPDRHVFAYYSKTARYYYDTIDLNHLPSFNQIYLDQRALTILPAHTETYFDLHDKDVLTFARNYLDLDSLPNTEVIIATLLIDVNTTFIDEIISQMSLSENGSVYIVDTSGHNIYASDGNNIKAVNLYSRLRPYIDDGPSSYQVIDNQYLFYKHIDNSDWLMIYNIDKSNVMHLIDDLKAITSVILGGIFFATLFIAITFSNNLSKPIRSIITQMKQVSAGNLQTKVKVKASYEVTQLADAFNEMTIQLRSHIDRAYGAQIKQREAELNALKTQIRPHYLYNTLEIIRMSALEEDANDTREMIESLSEQLKYVIGQYGDQVPLGKEIEMIENYFRIIELRYEGRISLSINLAKNYYTIPVLKLLLQPLVENAVVHGLKVKKGKGKVRVSGDIDDGILSIYVMDDGVGMSQTKVNEIQALLDSEQMGKELDGHWENIGLKNVHDRIQMIYGKAYGLTISSKENFGSKMSIRFPVEER